MPPGFAGWSGSAFPRVAGLVADPGGLALGRRSDQGVARGGAAVAGAGFPNVLLIVLDTVAADHLSLYGYDRPTSPTLEELAHAGIRFDRAQATSSWTLPSHASFFTGRWPHELSAGWLTPLDATASDPGRVSGLAGLCHGRLRRQLFYCGVRLGAGPRLHRAIRTTSSRAHAPSSRPSWSTGSVEGSQRSIGSWRIGWISTSDARGGCFRGSSTRNRKSAAVVNREFLDWLSRRRQPERPFFAFLNYYDAHYPYQLPEMGSIGSGSKPATAGRWTPSRTGGGGQAPALRAGGRVARDAYDDCVADLDEQLGRLIDELERRAILERTWVIVTVGPRREFRRTSRRFRHGTSLYQTELHVPLVIVPPAGRDRRGGSSPRR